MQVGVYVSEILVINDFIYFNVLCARMPGQSISQMCEERSYEYLVSGGLNFLK